MRYNKAVVVMYIKIFTLFSLHSVPIAQEKGN